MIPSLSWTSHTESIYSNASRTRGYLRRNLKNASPEVGKTSPHNVHSTEIGVFNICLASITVLPHHWLKNNSEPYCTFYNIKPWKGYQYHTIKIITKTTDTHLTPHHLMTAFYMPSITTKPSRNALLKQPLRTRLRISHSHSITRIWSHTSNKPKVIFFRML